MMSVLHRRWAVLAVLCTSAIVFTEPLALTPPTFMVFIFDGGMEIGPAGEKTLKEFVSAYKEKLSGKVDFIGHTESAEASIALSQARADAVRNRLLALGIPSDRICVIAQGNQRPLVSTRPGVAEPQNRLVKIWLS
jgi:outer membrane protein OmpA-like peptidoglycan-associated protein